MTRHKEGMHFALMLVIIRQRACTPVRASGMQSVRARVACAPKSGPPSQGQALQRRHVIDLPERRVRLHRPAPALLAVPAATVGKVSLVDTECNSRF